MRYALLACAVALLGLAGLSQVDAPPAQPLRLSARRVVHGDAGRERALAPDGAAPTSAARDFREASTCLSDGLAEAGEIVQEPDGLAIVGRVRDAWSGAPVAHAVLRALDLDREAEVRGRSVTDGEGRFRLPDVRAHHPYRLAVAAPGMATVCVDVTIPRPRTGLVIDVGGGGVVEGEVRDAQGAPVSGLDVALDPPAPVRYDHLGDDFGLALARTDAGGRFRLRGVVPGQDHVVIARVAECFQVRSDTFWLARDRDHARVTLRLPRPARVRVLQGEHDYCALLEGEGVCAACFDLEDDGAWLFDPVGPGTYCIRVLRLVGGDGVRTATLGPGEEREVVLTEDPNRALEGTVVGPAGEPLTSLVIWRVSPAFGFVCQGSDAQGRLRLVDLPGGPARLEVIPDDTGYAIASLEDVFPGGAPVRVVVARGAVLHGRLVGVPEDEQVVARIPWQTEELHPDGDGRFSLNVQRLGEPLELAVAVWAKNPVPARVDVEPLESGERRDVGDIVIEAGHVLEGRVVDARGVPVEAAKVCVAEDWWRGDVARTDPDGRFHLPALPTGQVRLRVDAEGFPSRVLRAGTDEPATLVLGPD